MLRLNQSHGGALIASAVVLLSGLAGCGAEPAPDSVPPGEPMDAKASAVARTGGGPAGADIPVGSESVPAGGVVVRITGPGAARYPVGTSFAAGELITLNDGDQMVLLNGDGTRTLSGPGSFFSSTPTGGTGDGEARGQTLGRIAGNLGADEGRSAAAAARMPARPTDAATSGSGRIDTASRYAAALFDGEGRSAAAATRRTVAPPGLADDLAALPDGPGLWTYALGSSGSHCLPMLNDIVFARRGGGEAVTVSITPGGGEPRSLTLPAGRPSAGWTGNWLSAGTRYQVSVDGAPPQAVRFVAIGAPPREPAALARLLAEHGCTRQVQRLARMMGASGIGRDDMAFPGRRADVRPHDVIDGGVRPREAAGGVVGPRGGTAIGDVRPVGGHGEHVVPDAPAPIEATATPVVRPRLTRPTVPTTAPVRRPADGDAVRGQ